MVIYRTSACKFLRNSATFDSAGEVKSLARQSVILAANSKLTDTSLTDQIYIYHFIGYNNIRPDRKKERRQDVEQVGHFLRTVQKIVRIEVSSQKRLRKRSTGKHCQTYPPKQHGFRSFRGLLEWRGNVFRYISSPSAFSILRAAGRFIGIAAQLR